MKTGKKIALLVGSLALVTVLFAIAMILYMGTPTKGNKISDYENPRKALLVIDIQEDFSGRSAGESSPFLNDAKILSTVNETIQKAVDRKMIIIYIRQEFSGFMGTVISHLFLGGKALPGNPGTEIDGRIRVVSSNIFPKPRGDSFSNPDLESFLLKNKVNELYLTGLDAEFCVHATARGALNRGYRVNIITDAILLSAKEKWDDLLAEYREEGINLLTSGELK